METAALNIALASLAHDALVCIERAQAAIRADLTPNREAIQHELASAATSLGRVLALAGAQAE